MFLGFWKNEQVAIKKPKKGEREDELNQFQQFFEEKRLLGCLEKHAFIVSVFGYFYDIYDNSLCFVMEVSRNLLDHQC